MTDATPVISETPEHAGAPEAQDLAARGSNRSQRPDSDAFKAFITSGWAPRAALDVEPLPAAPYTAARRAALSARFPGARLVVPAGPLKTRSNDTDYRFRPHSAFAHLTGYGTDQEPDAVLVLHPVEPGTGDDGSDHHAVLYVRPLAARDTEEFYADARYGEFWVGARPSLDDVTTATGIEARHVDELRDALAKDVGPGGVTLLVVAGADEAVEALVEAIRAEAGAEEESAEEQGLTDEEWVARAEAAYRRTDAALVEAVSELRLVKDAHEVEQMREAVAATIAGFEEVVRNLARATAHRRGERVIETTFDAHARLEGNTVGYETIAAAGEHATTLHWIRNDGVVRAGELVLLDAGVEVDSLYTADITRTLPVDGEYTDVQRRVYQAVLDAADAAFAVAVPGARFRDVHAAAMEVIAARLEEWGLLPVTAAESLSPEGQQHRRWMVHGTSHHLGLDVHDCAQARRELYLDGVLEPGMVFTIEPGLYFKADDLAVPEEYRGIGVRIEDDVLVTADGNENLSAALPRRPEDVEAWMARLRG
ncbi:M24 family metallopeptidase [Cellulosimicrobium sp. BIT-GX5]|uniref:Xaa-Pro aminopeptidase n=1 Tax=Cellulosimicrobium composti TaxID=2672572 RepID=A0A6N7ZKN7_9MICO|nr:aminopeptidase P family protein [Cellulosimicrobium composti]MTG89910.1 M24 family metallopeptidase [Cellulosimicrobium composti]TWG83756.1 Xaa-Pro aminopeptidase [Cellulosimicrobium cellulans J34]SMF44778.1 Xaa-Pro aminopeptidase [Cellulosimicrobium cellulans J1]